MYTNLVKPSWYRDQFKGWSPLSYLSLLFGYGLIIGSTFGNTTHISVTALVTMLAGILGYTSVSAIVNQAQLSGILGLLSALLYIDLAILAHNPSDAILNLTFILVLDLPIIVSKTWGNNLKPSSIRENNWVIKTIAFFVVVWLVLFFGVEQHLNTTQTLVRWFLDATASSLGITAGLMTVFKIKESFYLWALQNIAMVCLWAHTAFTGDASYVLALTYLMYTVNSAVAFTGTTQWNIRGKQTKD